MEDTNFDTSREDALASQLASSVGTKEIALELLRSGASLAPGKDCAGEAFRWACANGIHGVVASMLSMRDTYGHDIVNFARSGEGTPLTESAGNGHKAAKIRTARTSDRRGCPPQGLAQQHAGCGQGGARPGH